MVSVTVISALLIITRSPQSRSPNHFSNVVADCEFSTICYVFTVSNSGLLSMQHLLPSPTHFRHRQIPELISGIAGKPACIEPAAGNRLAEFVDHAQPAPVCRPFRASLSATGPA